MPAKNRHSWYVVGLLTVCYVLSLIDRLIVGLLVEPMKASLGLSDFEIALLQGPAFAILYAVLGVPLGRVADIWNRKNLISIAIALWSVATMGCGLAGGFISLLIARIGVGVGEAALSPSAYSMFADMFDKGRLGRAISVFTVGGIAGVGLSLLLGGALFGYFSSIGPVSLLGFGVLLPWQMTFVVLGIPGIAIAFVIYFGVQEPERAGAQRTVEPVAAVAGYIIGHGRFYASIFVLHALIAGVLYGFYNWAPSYLIRDFAMGPQIVGPRFGLLAIAAGITGPLLAGWIADRLQVRYGATAPLFTAGGFFAVLAVVSLFAFRADTFELALVGCGMVALFGSAMLGLPPIALQLATPNRMRGQVSGLSLMISNLVGLGAGPVVIAGLSEFVFPDQGLGFVLMVVIATTSVCGAALGFWATLKADRKILGNE
ncbi:MFS transporter [Kordiimonas pumila]|uniref:MFS transporter n=1 Tax=Kordiimonas pumila TaxID=2161677 RepID=A0ABV7D572_9PROT|nr:MFS transporter [Kordiimonas pumila]